MHEITMKNSRKNLCKQDIANFTSDSYEITSYKI